MFKNQFQCVESLFGKPVTYTATCKNHIISRVKSYNSYTILSENIPKRKCFIQFAYSDKKKCEKSIDDGAKDAIVILRHRTLHI